MPRAKGLIERAGLPQAYVKEFSKKVTRSAFRGVFACDDAEATYRQLKARGVDFVSESTKEPWGTYMIMRELGGNQFVVGS